MTRMGPSQRAHTITSTLSLVALAKTLAMTTLSLANVHFWQTADYFADAAELNVLLHCWSLGVEEQFYVVVPLLLLGVSWVARGARMAGAAPALRRATLVVLCVGSCAYAAWAVARVPTSTFFLLPPRLWELMAGSLIAVSTARPARLVSAVLGPLGVAAIAVAVVAYDKETIFPGASALLPVLGAAAVIVAGGAGATATPTPLMTLLSSKPLLWLGLRSYSLYLWHWPLLALGRHALQRPLDAPSSLC
jgi:peptidoglycan/LPS O-acetylase OafA/YrhL